MRVVHQKQEDVPVTGVERRGFLGHIDEGIVLHGRPIQNARHLPAGFAQPVARDLPHRADKFVVPDAAIVRPGDRAQFGAPVIGLKALDQLGAMVGQAILQIDPGQRRGKLAHVAGGGGYQSA